MEHLWPFSFGNVLFYTANALWILEFVFFRNKKKHGEFKEKVSFWFISFLIATLIVLSIRFAHLNLGQYHQEPIYLFSQILALGFYAVGLGLRYQGSFVLGANFTRHVAVSKNMPLISHGPYLYLRHPLYLGLLLIILAFPLYIGNWLSFIILFPFLITAFAWRMHLEEKALVSLHPGYDQWRKKRYRFIPFIY